MREKRFVSCIITAGGTGTRMGTAMPKQFVPMGGKPVLTHTIAVFDKAACVDEIILTVPADWLTYTTALVESYGFTKIKSIISGGDDRQASVRGALGSVYPQADIVLVHDGVRPFIAARHIETVIDCVQAGYVAVMGVKTKDTLKITDADDIVTATPKRENAWIVQTPQGFTYKDLLMVHEKAFTEKFSGTDDAVLAERLGLPVKMVAGDYMNIKITTPDDLWIGEAFLRMLY